MDDSQIELIAMSGDEAARVVAGAPGDTDNWAAGFPRQDDRDGSAALAAAAADPGPYGNYRIVVRAHGQTIGTAGFYGPPDEAGQVTIGYGLVDQEWGNGYGTEAVAGLIEICRRNRGVSTIVADTDLDNIASRRVLEKNGFGHVRTTAESCYFELKLS
jgi:RimJ/RimL family protein N-acetyltransferase